MRALIQVGAVALSAVLTNSCSEQPKVQCTASRATFAARYTLVKGEGVCAQMIGEVLGVQSYVTDPRNPGDGIVTVAIQSANTGNEESLGRASRPEVLDPNPDHRIYALGKFTNLHPDPSGICHIPEMSPAELDRGPVRTTRMLDPAISVKHLWKNVRFLVTPAHTGVTFEADLTYVQDDCEAEYKVVAISPAADCDNGNVQPDQAKCSPEADGTKNFAGSGIAPDFDVQCERDPVPPEARWVTCLPANRFPPFR